MSLPVGEPRYPAARLANAAVVLFAWSLPVSLFGMQAGVVAMLAVCLLYRGSCLRRSPLDTAVILLLAAALLSLLCAPVPPTSLVSATSFWVASAFFLAYWLLRREAQLRLALTGIIMLACLAALLGVWQAATASYPATDILHPGMDPRLRLVPISGRPAAVGFFFSRLTFAHVLLFPFCWSAALAAGAGPARLRLLGAAAAVVIGAGIFTTWTRAAPVAGALALAGLLVAGVRAGTRRWLVVVLLVMTALAAVLTVPVLRQRLVNSFAGKRDWTRLTIWHTALDLAAAQPLTGVGYGNFQRLARRPIEQRSIRGGWRHFGGVVAWAHDNLFTFLAEAGLLGAWAFCLLFVAYFRKLLSFLRQSQAPPGLLGAVVRGSPAAVAAFLFVGLFHDTFFDGEVIFNLWFAMAASLAALALSRNWPLQRPGNQLGTGPIPRETIPAEITGKTAENTAPEAGDRPRGGGSNSAVIAEGCWWLLVVATVLLNRQTTAGMAIAMAGGGVAALLSRQLSRLLPVGLLLGVGGNWHGGDWALLGLLVVALVLAGAGWRLDRISCKNSGLGEQGRLGESVRNIRLALVVMLAGTWSLAAIAHLLLHFRTTVHVEPGSLVLLPVSAAVAGIWIGLDGLVRRGLDADRDGLPRLGALRFRLAISLLLLAGLLLIA